MNCTYCNLIPRLKKEESHRLIREFETSYLISGDHQTFEGYCVLVMKEHVKELTDLSIEQNSLYFAELMATVEAMKQAFTFDKINLSNYGNMTPHLHWHIFPRRTTDQNWPNPPWTAMEEFELNKTTKEESLLIKNSLVKFL